MDLIVRLKYIFTIYLARVESVPDVTSGSIAAPVEVMGHLPLYLQQLLLTLHHGVEQRRLYLEFKSLKGKYIYEIVTSLILIMNHHEAGNITKYFCITKNYYKS